MINKKIILSLLTLGMLACVASAGTWAYFQDTITSTGNGVSTATLTTTINDVDVAKTAGDTGQEAGHVALTGMIPTGAIGAFTDLQPLLIGNKAGSTANAIVTATVVPVTNTLPQTSKLVVKLGSTTIYQNGAFVNSPVTLASATTPLAPGSTVDGKLTYSYPDDGNQNADEGLGMSFNVVITSRAV